MRLISKSLVVGAVAGACAYAAAGTITAGTMGRYSLESANAVAAGTTIKLDGNAGSAPNVASYTAGTMALEANNLAVTSTRLRFTSNRAFGSADSHASTMTCSATTTANTTMYFTLSNATSSSEVIYDLTNRGSDLTTDVTCDMPLLGFSKSGFASTGDISVGANVVNINSGFTLETVAAVKLASVGASYSIAIASTLDAVIDVSQNRLTFASGTDTVPSASLSYSDNFSVTVTPVARATVNGTFARTFNLTLTAGTDFGYLEEPAGTTGGGSCTLTSGSGRAYASSGTLRVTTSFECKTMTLTAASPSLAGATTYTVGLGRSETTSSTLSSVNAASATPFAPQAYTATYGITGGTDADGVVGGTALVATSASQSAGSWTLNGTSITLQYVPVASDTNLQLFVSNTGAAGSASFTATNHAGASCSGTLGAVGVGSTSLGSALKRSLLGIPGTGETSTCSTTFASEGRAAVVVTTTTPSSTTRVHSGFSKSDGVSRQIIVNSGN